MFIRRISFIALHDIAAAVVAAFQRPLAGQEFDLAGPEALDHAEAARIVSEASGRPVAYHSLSQEQMLVGARAQGMPEPAIGYLAVLYSVVRTGFAAGITGRRPVSFAEFARVAAGAWK